MNSLLNEEIVAQLSGIPLFPSPYVKLGSIYKTEQGIVFHEHHWIKWRKTRKHGARRGMPRRVKVVAYRTVTEPAIKKILEESRNGR